MRIEKIVLTEHIDEMWELFSLHREELATNKEIMILNPDWDRYRSLEKAGSVLTLAAYHENKIIGYSVTMIYKNLHYSDLMDAFNDVLFIREDYRKKSSGIGVRLIRKTEQEVSKLGAKRILFHGKENTAFSALMPRLGYSISDLVYAKEL